MNPRELLTDPDIKARGFFEHVTFPPESGVGTRTFIGRPWEMSRSPSYIRSPAPDMGGDNERVLGELLGRDNAEVGRLYEIGALGKEPKPLSDPAPAQDLDQDVRDGLLVGYDTDYKKVLGVG